MSDEVKVRNVCFISKINLPEYPGPVTQECLRPQVFTDPMVGSGTSVEVAREIGIEAYGLDLHSGFNILDLSRCATEDEFLRKLRVALGNQRCATICPSTSFSTS